MVTILNHILFRIYLRKYKRNLSIGQMEEFDEIEFNNINTTKGLLWEIL